MAESNNSFRHTLAVRAVSGAALVAVMLAVLWLGGLFWHIFAAVAALGSLWEFFRMQPGLPAGAKVLGIATGGAMIFLSRTLSQTTLLSLVSLCCFLVYFMELARRQMTGESNSISSVGPVIAGLAYIIVPWYCMIFLRLLPDPVGFAVVLSLFLCTWACDVAAYLTGSKFGSIRVCPHISPNKSLEGFIGGLVGSLLCGAACALVFGFHCWAFILQGAVCGTLGQLGDLTESLIKRECGVKDSGQILPGHGGFLDRFDSVLISALCSWFIWWGAMP